MPIIFIHPGRGLDPIIASTWKKKKSQVIFFSLFIVERVGADFSPYLGNLAVPTSFCVDVKPEMES